MPQEIQEHQKDLNEKTDHNPVILLPTAFEVDLTASQIAAQACKLLNEKRKLQRMGSNEKLEKLLELKEMKDRLRELQTKKEREWSILAAEIRAELNMPLSANERVKLQRELAFLQSLIIQEARLKEPLSLPILVK